jgi:hypothetical protein
MSVLVDEVATRKPNVDVAVDEAISPLIVVVAVLVLLRRSVGGVEVDVVATMSGGVIDVCVRDAIGFPSVVTLGMMSNEGNDGDEEERSGTKPAGGTNGAGVAGIGCIGDRTAKDCGGGKREAKSETNLLKSDMRKGISVPDSTGVLL